MYWNYRMVRHEDENLTDDTFINIMEVYYDESNDMPVALGQSDCLYASDENELAEKLEMIKIALDKPVLSYNDIVKK